VALNVVKPAMLNQLHTILSYVSEYFPFKLEEFRVHAITVEPPSLGGFNWDREADRLVSDEGTILSVPEILSELCKMQLNTL
jgi:hypothetical protein